MSKRFAISGVGLLVVILAVGLWQAQQMREPVYEGRKLSEWMEGHLPSSAANPPYGSEG